MTKMICPKAKQCTKYCYHHKRQEHNRDDDCCNANIVCPACVPVDTQKPAKVKDKKRSVLEGDKPKENRCEIDHFFCKSLECAFNNKIFGDCDSLNDNYTKECESTVAQVNAATIFLQSSTGLIVRLLTKKQAEKVDRMLKEGVL